MLSPKICYFISPSFPYVVSCSFGPHTNEGAIEEYHIGKRITCFLRLHDDFAYFSSISLISIQWLA